MIGWLAAGAALVGFGVYARWIEPRWLKRSRIRRWLSTGSTRHSTGTHRVRERHPLGAQSTEWLEDVVLRVNGLEPDLVAVGGDIIHTGTQNISEGLSILDGLRAPDGVWCVLGNHDYRRSAVAPARCVGRWGVRAFANSGTKPCRSAVETPRSGLRAWAISGATRATSTQPWRASRPTNRASCSAITPTDIAKSPAGVWTSCSRAIRTEGQVRLPFVGPIFTRTASSRRLAAGLTSVGGTQVYVGRGVSQGKWKVRFLSAGASGHRVARAGHDFRSARSTGQSRARDGVARGQGGVDAGGTARRTPLDLRGRRWLGDGAMNTLERPWGRLAFCYKQSHEPALVLVHGSWCDANDWNVLLPYLPAARGPAVRPARARAKRRPGRPDGVRRPCR